LQIAECGLILTLKMRLTFALLLASVLAVSAETKTFRNEGLKNETIVTLDIQGKTVTGTFVSSEYTEETTTKHVFSGEIVPNPKGDRGVCMRIRFDRDVPYSAPPGAKVLRWYLKIVDYQAHLFIPMQERSYESKTSKWIVSEVEFLPTD
jgi:hypothetical protein